MQQRAQNSIQRIGDELIQYIFLHRTEVFRSLLIMLVGIIFTYGRFVYFRSNFAIDVANIVSMPHALSMSFLCIEFQLFCRKKRVN